MQALKRWLFMDILHYFFYHTFRNQNIVTVYWVAEQSAEGIPIKIVFTTQPWKQDNIDLWRYTLRKTC